MVFITTHTSFGFQCLLRKVIADGLIHRIGIWGAGFLILALLDILLGVETSNGLTHRILPVKERLSDLKMMRKELGRFPVEEFPEVSRSLLV